MSSPSNKRLPSRRLLYAGLLGLTVAGAIAVNGIISRANSTQDLVQWTGAHALPTVAIAQLAHGGATENITLPGTIQPYSKAMIYARVGGYLHSWQQDIGAHVTAGQVLATIDSPDLDQQLDQAKADFATAEANEKLAIITANRWQLMGASQAVSRQAVDEKVGDASAKRAIADSAQANVRRLEALAAFKSVAAPFDGIVTLRNTDVGALINAGSTAGQELFEVSDLHRVRLYVQVPQAFSAQLHPGLKATFELPQYPGARFDATVTTTSNAMNAASRSLLVELQADNADGKLMGGTYCQVTFQIPGNPNNIRVPATALMPVNNGAQVAVLSADNKVMLKTIQLRRDFGDSIEVRAGLTPQDRVIDSPLETLQSGDIVQLATTAPPAKGS